MLVIKNLTKIYAGGQEKAVDDISFETKPGEIFGFLGPNGAGKTTTIKMLAGILPFETGTITINGYDIRTQPLQAKRSFGFVPDDHIVYDKLTGREYINFLSDIYGVSVADRKTRAESILQKFGLMDAFDSQISTYSHGMKQKISVIGALIHNPELWVLDEPLTGLDPQSAFELKSMMREHAKSGKTVFFSTHNLDSAEKLCDRVGIINKGKLVKIGTLEEIKLAGSDASLEDLFLRITAAPQAVIAEEAAK